MQIYTPPYLMGTFVRCETSILYVHPAECAHCHRKTVILNFCMVAAFSSRQFSYQPLLSCPSIKVSHLSAGLCLVLPA